MAITALRSGAKLPISINPKRKDQIVVRIPPGLEDVLECRHIHVPPPPPLTTVQETDEPEVYDVY